MAVYQFANTEELAPVARKRGWMLGLGGVDEVGVALPQVGFRGADGEGSLPGQTVNLRAPVQLALPNARIGRNLATMDWTS